MQLQQGVRGCRCAQHVTRASPSTARSLTTHARDASHAWSLTRQDVCCPARDATASCTPRTSYRSAMATTVPRVASASASSTGHATADRRTIVPATPQRTLHTPVCVCRPSFSTTHSRVHGCGTRPLNLTGKPTHRDSTRGDWQVAHQSAPRFCCGFKYDSHRIDALQAAALVRSAVVVRAAVDPVATAVAPHVVCTCSRAQHPRYVAAGLTRGPGEEGRWLVNLFGAARSKINTGPTSGCGDRSAPRACLLHGLTTCGSSPHAGTPLTCQAVRRGYLKAPGACAALRGAEWARERRR